MMQMKPSQQNEYLFSHMFSSINSVLNFWIVCGIHQWTKHRWSSYSNLHFGSKQVLYPGNRWYLLYLLLTLLYFELLPIVGSRKFELYLPIFYEQLLHLLRGSHIFSIKYIWQLKQSIHQPTSHKNHDTFREKIPNQEQNQTQIINPYKLSVCKLIPTIIQNQIRQKHINRTSNQSIHRSNFPFNFQTTKQTRHTKSAIIVKSP